MKKILIIIAAILGVAIVLGAIAWAELMTKPAVEEATWLYIRGNEVQNPEVLEGWPNKVALGIMGFDSKLKSGKLEGAYKLTPELSPLKMARKVVQRRQDAVKLTFRNIRLREQLAARLAKPLMCDSVEVLNAMLDPEFLKEAKTDSANVESIFLPDTYEVYWNISPKDLMHKMLKEYNKFWNDERLKKAQAIQLTPQEVSTLASIAEEETSDRQERGTVARLYWNRLQKGMMLQADPTVKFAVGDFSLRRILLKHLEVESPYNTYRNLGLPPGPIRVVEKATIDTILNSRPHDYIFMCAKPDFSGRHNFARNGAEHMQNAAAYHKALNAIKK